MWARTRMAMLRAREWGGRQKKRKRGIEEEGRLGQHEEGGSEHREKRSCGGWEHVQARIGLRLLWMMQGTAPPGKGGWG